MRLRVARVVLPDRVADDVVVTIHGGRIERIGAGDREPPASHAYANATLLPGVIDVHVHGSGGWRIGADGSQDEAVAGMRRSLAASGVTAFLPTIGTTTDDVTLAALDSIARAVSEDALAAAGARVLGSHLEGPYLNPKRKGAMRADLMRLPEPTHFESLWQAARGTLRYLTLAPELPGAEPLVATLREREVFVSAGHTDALAAQMLHAFDRGVQGVTHLFNAMRGLHHREPGVAGAALVRDDVWVELIGDGIHVHPDVMRLVFRQKGANRVAIVSDTGRYAGMPSGTYEEPHRTVVVDGMRCAYPDGTLAGSASPMNRNLQLLHHELGLPWTDIAVMTAANPAAMLGLQDRIGSIEVGKDADLVVLDDTGTVALTLVRGDVAYDAKEEVRPT